MAPLWSSVEVIDLTGEDEDESREPQPVPAPLLGPLHSPSQSDDVKVPTDDLLLSTAGDVFRSLPVPFQSYVQAEYAKLPSTKQDRHARRSILDLLSTSPYVPKRKDRDEKRDSTDSDELKPSMSSKLQRDRRGRLATADGLRKPCPLEEDVEQFAEALLRAFQNETASKSEVVVPNGAAKAGPFNLSQSRVTTSLKRTANGELKYEIAERSLPAAASTTAHSTASLKEIQQNQRGAVSKWRLFKGARSPSISDMAPVKRAKLSDGDRAALSHQAVMPQRPEAEVLRRGNIERADSLPSLSSFDERAPEIMNDMHRKHTRRRKTASRDKPYLGMSERGFLCSSLLVGEWDNQTLASWEGTALHNDFDTEEKHAIWDSIRSVLCMHKSSADQFSGVPWNQVKTHLDSIVKRAQSKGGLRRRSRRSIESFVKDLLYDLCTATRSHRQLVITRRNPAQKKTPAVGPFLRSRELGISRRSGQARTTLGAPVEIQNRVYDTLGPSSTFTGTSGDVGTVAWSPDGLHFAAGSIALMDSSSMQYNQPNNLLLGDIAQNSLRELPDHKIERKKPSKGINATEAMHRSQDPVIFTTVSVVKFSPDNHFMYSTGYDHNLKAWDLRAGSKKNSCLWSFPHKAVVDLLTVGQDGIVATGSQRTAKNSIKVLKCDQDGDGVMAVHAFQSAKAAEKPDSNTFPSSLTLGSGWSKSRLLAGFSSNIGEDLGNYTSGETCLWDIETGQQVAVYKNTRNVFDCVWHPNKVTFGVGSLAGSGVNRGTRSVVRLYDPRMDGQRCSKYTDRFELECPAYDMNDIVFCPYDDNIVSASCTSGQSFVWDIRHPDDVLHTLTHGHPLIELPGHDIREKEDTGIRFASFGHSRNRFYTGSSDGIVKSWDIYRSPEEVWVRDVIACKSGIMSGAFSPDFSNLILGEVNGTINLLSVGREDMSVKDAEPFHLERANNQHNTTSSVLSTTENDETNLGIRTANALVASSEIVLRPLGCLPFRQAVQGPKYTGPFYKDSVEAASLRAQATAFQKKFQITDEPCTINHSADYAKITEEERVDSGRSRDRIPHALKWPIREENREGKTAKCVVETCGLPANPSGEERAFCERCWFECLNCGRIAYARIWQGQEDYIECFSCKSRWRVDCLGFTALDWYTGAEIPVSLPNGDNEARRLEEEENVEWYYHSRWETP